MARHDWTRDEIFAIYSQPFPELVFQAQTIHRRSFPPSVVQR